MESPPTDQTAHVQSDIEIDATELDDRVVRYRYEYHGDTVCVRFQTNNRRLVRVTADALGAELCRYAPLTDGEESLLVEFLEQELGIHTHDAAVLRVSRTADGRGSVWLKLTVPTVELVNELGKTLTTLPGR
jgi:hypothetical protein